MFTFLLILQTVIAIVMISVILMQRSEGGGFAGGSSPSGLMTARGASDFLTRTTSITATIFVVLSITLAALAAGERAPRTIDPNLAKQMQPAPAGSPAEQQSSPFTPDSQTGPGAQAPAPKQAPADNGAVPLAQ